MKYFAPGHLFACCTIPLSFLYHVLSWIVTRSASRRGGWWGLVPMVTTSYIITVGTFRSQTIREWEIRTQRETINIYYFPTNLDFENAVQDSNAIKRDGAWIRVWTIIKRNTHSFKILHLMYGVPGIVSCMPMNLLLLTSNRILSCPAWCCERNLPSFICLLYRLKKI